MKKIKSLLILSMFAVSLFPQIVNASFVNDEYPYYKSIANGATFDDENVTVSLDDQLITQTQDGLRDVRVVSKKENKETPFEIVGNPPLNKSLTGNISEVLLDSKSVAKNRYNLSRMKDENKKSYTFIPNKDIYEDVSFVYDLGKPETIDRIILFTYDPFASWNAITVEASDDNSTWKTIRSRIEDPHMTWRWYGFPRNTTYRYFKVTLEAKGDLKLNEVILQTRNDSTINFRANEGEQYRLYYGNMRSSMTEYGEIHYIEEQTFTKVELGDQKKNPEFNRDSDGDSVDYRNDNCPYDKNIEQKDSNNDGIGDECQGEFAYSEQSTKQDADDSDKQEGVKDLLNKLNSTQDTSSKVNDQVEKVKGQSNVNDRDLDSISNVFDNCPDVYNPSQYDKDLNGVGDACDSSRARDRYSQILVGILIFVCLVIVFSIMRYSFTSDSEKKSKKPSTKRKK